MATLAAIKKLETKMVATADALVLAVIARSVKFGVNELNTVAGKCYAAINAWKIAKGLPPG